MAQDRLEGTEAGRRVLSPGGSKGIYVTVFCSERPPEKVGVPALELTLGNHLHQFTCRDSGTLWESLGSGLFLGPGTLEQRRLTCRVGSMGLPVLVP